MKIGSVYVPVLFVGAALVGALIAILTFAGALAALPVWAASALCGGALMAVAFLIHYLLSARRLSKIVWENLPGFTGKSDTFADDVSKINNPTGDPLQLPREATLFAMVGGGAFFGLLFTISWLRWIAVVVAVLGAIVYAVYDFLPSISAEARAARAAGKQEKVREKKDK